MAENGNIIEGSGQTNVSSSKPQTLAVNSEKSSLISFENQTYQEVTHALPLAEDIARFRSVLEQKIIMEGLPASEWRKFYNVTLSQFPSILSYKNLLDSAIIGAEDQNRKLNHFWQQYQETGDKETDDGLAKRASDRAAHEMFRSIFGVEPQESVEIFKGLLTLRVMLDEEDFKTATSISDKNVTKEALELGRGFSFFIPEYGFSIMAFRKKNELTSEDVFHEFEHSKNSLLNRVKEETILNYPEKLDIPPNIVAKLTRRAQDSPPEMRIKDELLASFAPAGFIKLIPINEQGQYLQSIERFPELISALITNPEGEYYSQHLSDSMSKRNENSLRTSRLRGGAQALVDLFKLYYQEKSEDNAGRMAINILEQFPLKSWPAVVRLIRTGHNQQAA